ncbi:methylase [Candidatus Saccharibacteria bacterium RIFCSPHIGHO2_02_FULL_47_12]|nr:MAG: methylase [Candidatus Saccharibacteria bacterium RIFCSPHIGHO2_02_FULL_47_12]
MTDSRTNGPYKPTVSDEYAGKLKQWQDNIYEESKTKTTKNIEFLRKTFVVPPEVHPINPMSDLLGNSVLNEVKEADKVLDMGTGCGVNAILAASKSKDVVAVDINPHSIEAAKKNARTNHVDSRIDFAESDVFESVEGKFDLIIFDPPFRWFKPRSVSESSTTDENYQALTRFFANVHEYLKPGGRILLCFGSSGDIGYLDQLIGKSGLHKETIAQRDLAKDDIAVSYFTFRLTPVAQ